MAHCRDEFTKRWDNERGFTFEEAREKIAKVNEAYGVYGKNPKWKHAEIEEDHSKPKGGYMVIIETID